MIADPYKVRIENIIMPVVIKGEVLDSEEHSVVLEVPVSENDIIIKVVSKDKTTTYDFSINTESIRMSLETGDIISFENVTEEMYFKGEISSIYGDFIKIINGEFIGDYRIFEQNGGSMHFSFKRFKGSSKEKWLVYFEEEIPLETTSVEYIQYKISWDVYKSIKNDFPSINAFENFFYILEKICTIKADIKSELYN